jgi:hypothetical protein
MRCLLPTLAHCFAPCSAEQLDSLWLKTPGHGLQTQLFAECRVIVFLQKTRGADARLWGSTTVSSNVGRVCGDGDRGRNLLSTPGEGSVEAS